MLVIHHLHVFDVHLICCLIHIHLFTKNLEVHNHDTRAANNFHLPITNLKPNTKKELIMKELKLVIFFQLT